MKYIDKVLSKLPRRCILTVELDDKEIWKGTRDDIREAYKVWEEACVKIEEIAENDPDGNWHTADIMVDGCNLIEHYKYN